MQLMRRFQDVQQVVMSYPCQWILFAYSLLGALGNKCHLASGHANTPNWWSYRTLSTLQSCILCEDKTRLRWFVDRIIFDGTFILWFISNVRPDDWLWTLNQLAPMWSQTTGSKPWTSWLQCDARRLALDLEPADSNVRPDDWLWTLNQLIACDNIALPDLGTKWKSFMVFVRRRCVRCIYSSVPHR